MYEVECTLTEPFIASTDTITAKMDHFLTSLETKIMAARDTKSTDRREFLNTALKGIAVAPLGFILPVTDVLAGKGAPSSDGISSEIAKLPENDRQAKALGYKADATKVDSAQFNRKEHQLCSNCQLFSGNQGDMWGPCAIFSARVHPTIKKPFEVSATGWCRSWGPRAA
jgi:hypothetical protein